jgi:hypothetical protein
MANKQKNSAGMQSGEDAAWMELALEQAKSSAGAIIATCWIAILRPMLRSLPYAKPPHDWATIVWLAAQWSPPLSPAACAPEH